LSRPILLAILAFSSLIFANLTLFAFLSFGPLSQKVVTEKLIQELDDAHSLMRKEFQSSPLHHRAAKRVAPLLKRFQQFRAILLLDSNGRVIHREVIRKDVISGHKASRIKTPLEGPHFQDKVTPMVVRNSLPNADGSKVFGIGADFQPKPQQGGVALEYDSEFIQNEVEEVRQDLFTKLLWAIALSILLLFTGGIYVVHAYKRNKKFQLKARKADELAYVGTLASGLAHEIRNPLNSMNMNLQLIREDLVEMGLGQNTEIQDMFDGTSKEIHRLSKLVSSFLAYARPAKLLIKVQDVNQVVRETADFVFQEIKERDIHLDLSLDTDMPDIPLDENQMRQALLNVIQNAIHVLGDGQKLSITTRLAGAENLILVIEDEGPGIAPESLKEINKVFYSTKRGGTGLGLPIAQRIVEQHGGGLKLESTVGVGTKITFILPLVPVEEKESA